MPVLNDSIVLSTLTQFQWQFNMLLLFKVEQKWPVYIAFLTRVRMIKMDNWILRRASDCNFYLNDGTQNIHIFLFSG